MVGKPKSGKPKLLIAVAAAIVLVVVVVLVLTSKERRVASLLERVNQDPEGVSTELAALGPNPDYREILSRRYLEGGRKFSAQVFLGNELYTEPFYLKDAVREALDSDDPVRSRAAAVTLMEMKGMDARDPPGPLPERLYAVLADWAKDSDDRWLSLALQRIGRYNDPRIVDILVTVLTSELPRMESEDEDPDEVVSRIRGYNGNRRYAANAAIRYLPDERLVKALTDIVTREKEDDAVQGHALRAMMMADMEVPVDVLWIQARSENPLVRQSLADNLDHVKDRRVLPILLALAEDEHIWTRAGAITSLYRNRFPEVLDKLKYYAEDHEALIRGECAVAVDVYRKKELVGFLCWILRDPDPVVFEKAYVSLSRTTGKHHGFTNEEWREFGDANWDRQREILQSLMNDGKRKEKAIAAWIEEFDHAYGDKERVPYLIRQLGHKDRFNVHRAIRELYRITGRKEGFPELLLEPGDSVEMGDARQKFMDSDREKLIAEWQTWWAQNEDPAQPEAEQKEKK